MSASVPLRAESARTVPQVSILVPFWNEQGNLTPLCDELRRALDSQERAWEVLLVDDGSRDGSLDEAHAIVCDDARFRLESLCVHRGKSAALERGRNRARGAYLATIDADLQDDPRALLGFFAALDAGRDVVVARRENRREPAARRAATWIFNRTVRRLTRVPVQDLNAGLKAYRREVLHALPLGRGAHRFLAVLAHERGFDVTEFPVEHRQRHRGRSKYGIARYFETVALLGLLRLARVGPRRALTAVILGLSVACFGAWALLPATQPPALRVVGGALAVGAVVGALLLPRVRRLLSAYAPRDLSRGTSAP